eukprot:TRINITY_DN26800_c0_g1_i5.p1 TRINITY_DN26800_c0_g1~~TRINITY_DN26800_c0_g1_i5.p1  ORF type:complete len:380 (+),score=72.65 TRINITY_DN26800_c0_g1_i5:112-1251(+)
MRAAADPAPGGGGGLRLCVLSFLLTATGAGLWTALQQPAALRVLTPAPRATAAPSAAAAAPSAGAVSHPAGGSGALPHLAGIAVNGTVFATSGNWAFREFLANVVATLGEAVPSAVPVVAMLDVRGAQWCRGALPAARCALFRCPCPYAAVTNLSAAGYTQCLLGVYICKLRIKLAILERGFHVFFIDADAAPRRNVLQYLPPPPVAAVGACEHCSGTCELRPSVARLIDHPQVGPVALGNYWQLNIGFIWLNHTDPAPALALRESIAAIVSHRLDFKSVDQTVFNRRLIARRAATRCLPPAVGGLNIRGRGSRPKQWPDAWGVHAARLVSRDAFYKQALLWHNGLWRRNASAEFVDLVRRWQQKPKSLKRHLEQLGRL